MCSVTKEAYAKVSANSVNIALKLKSQLTNRILQNLRLKKKYLISIMYLCFDNFSMASVKCTRMEDSRTEYLSPIR